MQEEHKKKKHTPIHVNAPRNIRKKKCPPPKYARGKKKEKRIEKRDPRR